MIRENRAQSIENLGGSLKMPQNRQNWCLETKWSDVDVDSLQQTRTLMVEGVIFLLQRVTIFIVTFGHVTKIW